MKSIAARSPRRSHQRAPTAFVETLAKALGAASLTLCLSSVLTACPGMSNPPPPSENGARTFGRVADFLSSFTIEGLDVCQFVDGEPTDLCTVTDDNGEFLLDGLPENTDGILRFEKFSHFPLLGHWNSARQDTAWDVPLPDEGVVELNTSLALEDGELERGMGQIFFTARTAPIPGQPGREGIFVDAAPGSEALGETVYGNGAGLPSRDQVGTSGIGSAVWSNVPPGQYEIVVTGNCEPYFSNDAVGENLDTYPVTVVANHLSSMTIACAAP